MSYHGRPLCLTGFGASAAPRPLLLPEGHLCNAQGKGKLTAATREQEACQGDAEQNKTQRARHGTAEDSASVLPCWVPGARFSRPGSRQLVAFLLSLLPDWSLGCKGAGGR